MALSDEQLRRRLASLSFTAHNIRLADGITTLPGRPELVESDERLPAILGTLETIFGADLSGLRVADLACLEGGYALALARRGARVLGVEARRGNFEKLALVAEHFALPNLEFVRRDVKEFGAGEFGRFDAVLALGILYHLDRPAEWLARIAPAVGRVLLLDTHYAPEDDAAARRIDPRVGAPGPLEERREAGLAVRGRSVADLPEGTDPEVLPWAAYSNAASFWLTKESLLRVLRSVGFELLFEQHDVWLDDFRTYQVECPRALFVAVRGRRPAA
jgi:SAM-dependent methyltransferase